VGSLALWIKSTGLPGAITYYPWLWPICETLHFVGLALLIGVTGLFDLRLMGFMRSVPVGAAMDLMPWAILGFVINLVTGVIFFVGAPDQYINNVAFYFKILFIIIAGLNAMYFQVALFRKTYALEAGADTPVMAKVVGSTSLLCWLAVMYWGRMLPFMGNAF
jgi:hypothetical protein